MKTQSQLRSHKSSPEVPIQSDLSVLHLQTFVLGHISILNSHLRQGLPSGLFPSGLSITKLYIYIFLPTRVARLILPGSVTLIAFGKYK